MTNTNATNFRKNLFAYLDNTIAFNEVVNVSTKNGNAVVMSEEDYRSLMETLYLTSIPGMREQLLAAKNASDSEFIPERAIEW